MYGVPILAEDDFAFIFDLLVRSAPLVPFSRLNRSSIIAMRQPLRLIARAMMPVEVKQLKINGL
jgi:hypothetical protein